MPRWFYLPLVLASCAHAQSQAFWTRETIVTVSALSAATAADAYFTERNWRASRGAHESNPLVPGARAGRIGYFSGTLAAGIAGAWLLHGRHPRLAKWALRIGVGVEIQASAWSGSHP